ncbi:unnamed protein product [Pylaiella littoralis]
MNHIGKHGRAEFSTSPSASAAVSAAAAPPDTTQVVSDDIINMIATFSSCQDLCTFGRICRRFSPLPFHDDLWELRALDILPTVQQLRSAMSELKLTSYRQLVEAFTRIGIPAGVLGFWQAQTPTLSWAAQTELSARLLPDASSHQGGDGATTAQELEARGELLRITLEAGGFVCESIAGNGTCLRIFTIRVSTAPNGTVKIGFFSLEKESCLAFGGDDGAWMPGDSMAEAKARYTFAIPGSTERAPIRASGAKAFFLEREGGRTCRYVKLAAPRPPASCRKSASCSTSSSLSPPAVAVAQAVEGGAQGLCGLWCAPYGSHGLEIIHLSTDPSCSPSAGAAAAAAAAVAAAVAAESTKSLPSSPVRSSSSSWSRGDGGRAGSCSGVSTCRMTDDTESAYTSAPATDGAGSEEGDSSDDESVSSEVSSRTPATSRRRKRTNHAAGSSTVAAREGDDDVDDGGGGGGGEASVPTQLFGSKVTGDDNVPAGKTSFVIDLKTKFDVDQELQSDSRPGVMFLPTGAVMANLANRRGHMSSWCKGVAQINRVPGRWLPEWVDVEFVQYRAGLRCAFSVIFRQPTQAVRVVMDFERAPGCKEWPQWCAAGPSVDGGEGGPALNATASSSPSALKFP